MIQSETEDKIKELRAMLTTNLPSQKKTSLLNELSWLLRFEDPTKSLEYAQKAFDLSKNHEFIKEHLYAKLNIAVVHFLQSNEDLVLDYLIEARDFFRDKENEQGYPISLNFLAQVYDSYGDYETAVNFAQESVSRAQKCGYLEGEGDAMSTLGRLQTRLCDFKSALEHYEKSLKIREELGNEKAIASTLNLMARLFSLTGDFQKAVEYYQQSLELRNRINDQSGLPWTFLGLASLYESLNNQQETVDNYNKSLELAEATGDKRCQFQSKLGLGRIYLNSEKLDFAFEFLTHAMKIAKSLDHKPFMFQCHQVFGEYFEKTGDFINALEHFKSYQKLEKEVNRIESHSRLKNQQVAFATEQSKREAEIYQLRNVELKDAYDRIEEKNREITDSIRYALRIQNAVLPPDRYISKWMPEHFIFYRPKDIVSGDFYWMHKEDNLIYIVTADCTGHGIPGGFLSMLGVSFLNEIIKGIKDQKANEILNQLKERVIKSLHQTGHTEEAKDGMDMSLCIYDEEARKLQFAGAYNPLYLIRSNELEVLKADRMPIAIHSGKDTSFTNNQLPIQSGDTVYMFSDGYADQFGGPDGKKFMYRQFKNLFVSVQSLSMPEQLITLEKTFDEWKGDCEQVDDVLVMGIRFN